MSATLGKRLSGWSGGNSWCKGTRQMVAGTVTKSSEVRVALGSKSTSCRR